jgi:hypothetical protein
MVFDGIVDKYGLDSLTTQEQASRRTFAKCTTSPLNRDRLVIWEAHHDLYVVSAAVNIAALVKLFCPTVGGIAVTSEILEEWETMDELMNMIFTPSDIESINPKVKQMGITYTAQAMAFYLRCSFHSLFHIASPHLLALCHLTLS